MNRTTSLVLLVVVVCLGGAAWWQSRREARGDFDWTQRLFEGVDRSRVVALRIENLERGFQARIQRDSAHRWSITDPIAYPARAEIVQLLLEIVAQNAFMRVPDAELEHAREGFEPPRALLEVTERVPREDGAPGEAVTRSTTVELGALDVDGSRVYVRRDGEIGTTLRNLDTTLERPLHELRSLRVFDIAARDVVHLHRSGAMAADSRALPLLLEIERREIVWWMRHPWQMQVDPMAAYALAAGATALAVKHFYDDDPGELEEYHLDQPDLRVRLRGTGGEEQALSLVGSSSGRWLAKRDDLDYVWELEATGVSRLMMPAQDLLDTELVRLLRDELQSIELTDGERRTSLVRFDESWLVGEGAPAEVGSEGGGRPANVDRVEELLSILERAQIARHLFDDDPAELFAGAPERGVWATMRDLRQGGRVGGAWRSEGGAEGLLFLRDGESLASVVPLELERLFEHSAIDLESLELVELDEVRLRTLTLAHGDATREYTRLVEGSWRHADLDAPATELHDVLDALFFLRATEHVPRDQAEPLEDVVEVRVADNLQRTTEVAIGRSGSGRVEAEIEGRRSVLAKPDLHERLLAIFAE